MTAREDPLLSALADASMRKAQADQEIRLLLAYAQQIDPLSYQLAEVADAADMPIADAQTGYTQRDVVFAAHMGHPYGGPNVPAITALSSLLTEQQLGREFPGTAA